MPEDANADLCPKLEQSILEAEYQKLWRLIKQNVTRYYRRIEWNRVVHVHDVWSDIS